MHHTNPHHALFPQPQHILHQPITVKRAPPKPKRTHALNPLHHAPTALALDDKTDRRDPPIGIRARLAKDGHVWPAPQVAQQDVLERGLVGPDGGPGGGGGGGGGAEVAHDAGDGGRELVVGGGEAELALQGRGGVEVVAQRGQGRLGAGAGVEHGDVGAVDLGMVRLR